VNRDRRQHGRAAALGVAAAVVLVVTGGCGSASSAGHADPPAVHSQRPALTAAVAAGLLAAFDRSDSAASASGNIAVLGADEAPPALDDSIAAVHRAQASHSPQPTFSHADPVFAIPGGTPSCFLAAATLHLKGDEIPEYDVSQFIQGPLGGWQLNLHVLVPSSAEPQLALIGAQPATSAAAAIPAARRQALVSQVFARTTAVAHPDFSLLASSVVLDQELGAGWTLYLQALRAAHMTVSRTLTGVQWSACAARAGGSVIAFLTIEAADTIRPLPGGSGVAELTAQDPDMIGIGQRTTVRGSSISVSRVEEFLLSVPVSADAPAQILGLVDAPVSVSTVPADPSSASTVPADPSSASTVPAGTPSAKATAP